MKQGIVYAVGAVIVVAGLAAAIPPLRHRVRQVAADFKIINADTGDVMSSATYQRFAARRQAVAVMKAALKSVAAAESMFVADSGRPTTSFMGRYAFTNDKSNLGPSIEIQRDRWVAKVSNIHTDMTCSLTAMVDPATFDSITWRYQIGEPGCVGWSAAESTALANAPVPINPTPEPDSPANPLRAPRQHRDWGPVNNTPPPMPYIVKNACDGEGCLRPGTRAACSDVAALREKRLDAPGAFTIRGGEKFSALAIDLHVDAPGMVVFRQAMSNPPGREGEQIDSIAFTPSDTLYLLNSLGEGDWVWWFRGQLGQGYQFWRDIHQEGPAVLVQRPKAIRWVRARNAAGQEGWIVYDYEKLGRCVRARG